MDVKNFIKIINEEVSDFDFLNNNQYLKEKESTDLLNNFDFQKQFICDSLLNKNKIEINVNDAKIDGDWNSNGDDSTSSIELLLTIRYTYDETKEPITFNLNFNGNAINDAKMVDNSWCDDINITLNTIDGDVVNFNALTNAPHKIIKLFVREYVVDYITNQTNSNI